MTLLRPQDMPLWDEAKPYLDVRNNDEHTLVAYGVAKALLAQLPEAEQDVVLPAILLHDVGWKRIPPDLLLAAIGRNPTRKDLVFEHERHSVVIARDILTRHGVGRVEEILAIIDGHDTTQEARSAGAGSTPPSPCRCSRPATSHTTPGSPACHAAWCASPCRRLSSLRHSATAPPALCHARR